MSGGGAQAPSGGPRVVALGGGHGLATTLSAAQRYASGLTAVVSVADDGGSSGRLREVWDGPAPGDVRRCLLALADGRPGGPAAATWVRALDYRFSKGELAGHSLGNLVLVGLAETLGDFAAATEVLGQLLGVKARVLPATSSAVSLRAEVAEADGQASRVVCGQSSIAHAPGRVQRVWLEPAEPRAGPAVAEAIASADQVVIGPGSLFTSILATCLVPEVRSALAARRGGRVYVCNLRPQDAETLGFDADAHLDALASHGVDFDVAVFDPATEVGAPARSARARSAGHPAVVTADLARPNGHSHDPERLAKVLAALAPA